MVRVSEDYEVSYDQWGSDKAEIMICRVSGPNGENPISLRHSPNVLQSLILGRVIPPTNHHLDKQNYLREHYTLTGPGKFPKNLAYLLVSETFPIVKDEVYMAPDFEPIGVVDKEVMPEREYFRTLNYYKWRMRNAADIIFKSTNGSVQHEEIKKLVNNANFAFSVRNQIVRDNFGLATSMAYQRLKNLNNLLDADERLSLTSEALIDSVNLFDYLRGEKFSTYACTAMTRSVIQCAARKSKRRHLNVGDKNYVLDKKDVLKAGKESEQKRREIYDEVSRVRRVSMEESVGLDDRERLVLDWRYPMSGDRKKLAEIGKILKLTRERVRQIEEGAIRKLRKHLSE